MGKKVPVRMKAVVYALSPFQQKVMPGLWKALPSKIHHKISQNWLSAIFAVGPVLGTYAYVQNYKEKEKLEHRFKATMVAAYEEERNKILEQNRKKFLDLGITQISKTLSNLTASERKPQRVWKPKPKNSSFKVEPRRSTRQRNPIQSCVDEVDIGLPTRKRFKTSSAPFGSYNARPLEECRMASYEERSAAFKAAERLQESLESGSPSFVKSMLRSHVYSCFWLDHLPKSSDTDLVLEDENGDQWDAKYLSKRMGLSGGWRGFALEHKLDDGDALVFELVEPTRFKKLYIWRNWIR